MVYIHIPEALTEEEQMLMAKYAKLKKKVRKLEFQFYFVYNFCFSRKSNFKRWKLSRNQRSRWFWSARKTREMRGKLHASLSSPATSTFQSRSRRFSSSARRGRKGRKFFPSRLLTIRSRPRLRLKMTAHRRSLRCRRRKSPTGEFEMEPTERSLANFEIFQEPLNLVAVPTVWEGEGRRQESGVSAEGEGQAEDRLHNLCVGQDDHRRFSQEALQRIRNHRQRLDGDWEGKGLRHVLQNWSNRPSDCRCKWNAMSPT